MADRGTGCAAWVVVAAGLLAGCGGGGGGGGGSAPAAPQVALVFPPYGGVTEADSITVRGTASSTDGISGVTVSGVPATSGDGFATWTAEVPLALGDTAIAAQATGGGGAVGSPPAVTVRREGAILSQPYAVVRDAASGTDYVLGGRDPRLFAWDESTHVATVLSSPTQGAGPTLLNAYSLVLHAAANKAYVGTNWVGNVVLSVDLSTGDRAVVSGGAVGTGTPFAGLGDLELDVAGNRLLVTDYATPALFWVDLATGNRTVVSSDVVGTGPTFQKGSAATTALDLAHGRAIVAQGSTYTSVSLATGDRTVFSQYPGIGVGDNASAVSIEYDGVADRVLVGCRTSPTTFASVNPTTGERIALPAPAAPLGAPRCVDITAISLDAAGGRLLVADWEGSAIRSYDLASGVQADVWRTAHGTGIEAPKSGAATLAGDGRVLLLDEMHPDVPLSVDLATGARTVFDGGGVSLPMSSLFGPGALTTDAAHGRALYAGPFSSGLAAIDLVTGARTTLSPGTAGFGPTFASGALSLDTDGTHAWIATASTAQVLEVDLATGQRTLLSGSGQGAGLLFTTTSSVLLDAPNDRLFVGANVSGVDSGLFAVDLLTGDRTAVWTDGMGAGFLGAPGGLARGLESGGLLAAVGLTFFDVALATPATTAVASNTLGVGVRFGVPQHLAGVRADGIAVVYDGSVSAVLALDPVTGERLVLSK